MTTADAIRARVKARILARHPELTEEKPKRGKKAKQESAPEAIQRQESPVVQTPEAEALAAQDWGHEATVMEIE